MKIFTTICLLLLAVLVCPAQGLKYNSFTTNRDSAIFGIISNSAAGFSLGLSVKGSNGAPLTVLLGMDASSKASTNATINAEIIGQPVFDGTLISNVVHTVNFISGLSVWTFGATNNARRVTDAVVYGNNQITSATANFSSLDLSNIITVSLALGNTNNLVATITNVVNSTTVQVNNPATISSGAEIAWIGTDNTTAFANALAAANVSKQSVYIPAGNYICGTIVMPTNTVLSGDGVYSSVIIGTSPVVDIYIATGDTLENFDLKGPYWNASYTTGVTNRGIRSYNFTSNSIAQYNFKIQDVVVESVSVGLELENVSSFSVSQPSFYNCGWGAHLMANVIAGNFQGDRESFQNDQIGLVVDQSVYFDNRRQVLLTNGPADDVFFGCAFQSCPQAAVWCRGYSADMAFLKCYFELNGFTGTPTTHTNYNSTGHFTDDGNGSESGWTIKDCIFSLSGQSAGFDIYLSGLQNGTVSGNDFQEYLYSAYSGGYAGNTFSGNNWQAYPFQNLYWNDNGTNGQSILEPHNWILSGVLNAQAPWYCPPGLGNTNVPAALNFLTPPVMSGANVTNVPVTALQGAAGGGSALTNGASGETLTSAGTGGANWSWKGWGVNYHTPVGITNNLSLTTLFSTNIPGGAIGPNGTLEVSTLWSFYGSTNFTVQILYNSTVIASCSGYGGASGSVGAFAWQRRICNQNSQASQVTFTDTSASWSAANSSALNRSAVDTSATFTLSIKASGGGQQTNVMEACEIQIK